MLNKFSGKLLKTVVLGAAVLTVALAAVATSGVRPVAAIDDDPQNPDPTPRPSPTSTPTPATKYKVKLTFEKVTLENRDDGWEDALFGESNLEVYGKLTAAGGTANFHRMFGTDKFGSNPSNCPNDGVAWGTAGAQSKCLRGYGIVDFGTVITGAYFADVPLCTYNAAGACADSFGKGRNSTTFELTAGHAVTWSVDMLDRDEVSSHDTVCKVGAQFGPFTEAQLKPSNGSWVNVMNQGNNGNASCQVRVTLTRVP